jgi:hypothetical protein
MATLGARRRLPEALQRIDRPEAIVLAVTLAAIAAVGRFLGPFQLAIALAVQLALGGFGAVLLIGPARRGAGFARYATLALAAVAATVFTRLLPEGISLLVAPLVAATLWAVLWIELRSAFGLTARTALDLALTAIVFAGAAGIAHVLPPDAWPPPLALVALVSFAVGLRAAEARGSSGAVAVGQSLLQTLAVAQVGAAVWLLDLPGVVGPALVALAFYAWGGAVEALDGGATPRAVALEFGSLAALGLLVALLLHRT